jgi:hypothetical protein
MISAPCDQTEKLSESNYEKADEELWKDLKNEGGSFLEQDLIKFIFINKATGRAYVKRPSKYHEDVVDTLTDIVTSKSTTTNPVPAKTSGVMKLTTGGIKYPGVYIFGLDRTVQTGSGILKFRKTTSLQKENHTA